MELPALKTNANPSLPGLEVTGAGQVPLPAPLLCSVPRDQPHIIAGTHSSPQAGQKRPSAVPQLISFFLHVYQRFQPLQCCIFKLFIQLLKSSCGIRQGLRAPFHRGDVVRHGNRAKSPNPGVFLRGEGVRPCIAPKIQQTPKRAQGGRGKIN